MSAKLFERALGVEEPWSVSGVDFDEAARVLTIRVDFKRGSRFAVAGHEGEYPVHDTVPKRYRHLNFFQHECCLEVRTPRVKLPDGTVRLVTPEFSGRLAGFTLLFEALVLALAREMPFAAVARIVGESAHRVQAVCKHYVAAAMAEADLAEVRSLAVDETSRARGHDYVTLGAEPERRRVLFVAEGRGAETIGEFAAELQAHGCAPEQIGSASIDMSPAFIAGCAKHLPAAQITFDKFHVIAHASAAVDKTRRREQREDKSLKGLRWVLLRDPTTLKPEAGAALAAVCARIRSLRTARAWHYKEALRAILQRKQPNVVRALLVYWCTCVMRSKVEAMKAVACLIRRHLEGIVAWTRSRQTNGFLEAINGLFQAAKRRARGYTRLATIRTVIMLRAGKLDFSKLNPHVGCLPT